MSPFRCRSVGFHPAAQMLSIKVASASKPRIGLLVQPHADHVTFSSDAGALGEDRKQ